MLDRVNQYIDPVKPWELAKVESERQRLHDVCSTGLNFFWYLTVLLAPVLPYPGALRLLQGATTALEKEEVYAGLRSGDKVACDAQEEERKHDPCDHGNCTLA